MQISVDYPSKKGVLRRARLEIFPGETVGLVGQSGSGKSTMAHAILRLLEGTGASIKGEINLLGSDLMRMNERELRNIRGRCVSLVPQNPVSALNPLMTIGRQLAEAWRVHSREPWSMKRHEIAELLTTLGLSQEDAIFGRLPAQISVGQAQRVLLLMALLHAPPLVVADEPTSALDVITQEDVLRLLRLVREELGMAMLFISHDLPVVASICDRLAILHEGEIVESGPVATVLSAPKHNYTKRLVQAVPKWHAPMDTET